MFISQILIWNFHSWFIFSDTHSVVVIIIGNGLSYQNSILDKAVCFSHSWIHSLFLLSSLQLWANSWAFWIKTSCRPGEGWASPCYSCRRHAAWVTPSQSNQITRHLSFLLFLFCANDAKVQASELFGESIANETHLLIACWKKKYFCAFSLKF